MDASTPNGSVADLCTRLGRVPTAVVSDTLATMGMPDQVLASKIRSVGPCRPFAGPALCLSGSEGPEPEMPPGVPRPNFQADGRVYRGCVAVVATGGHGIGAVIGGNVGLSWRLRGCIGVVTDGGIRDSAEFEQMGLPVYAAFVGPMSPKGLWAFRDIDVPLTLPGQRGPSLTVLPGDIIHADGDGVVVVPAARAEQIVHDAEILEAMEARIRADLERGDEREAVYARYDRFGHIKAGS